MNEKRSVYSLWIEYSHDKPEDISEAERKLLQLESSDGEIDLLKGARLDSRNTDFAQSRNEQPERRIRAKLIRWLLIDKVIHDKLPLRGIWIQHARIEGELDLSHQAINLTLAFRYCVFDDTLNLLSSSIRSCLIHNCTLQVLSAAHAKLSGHFELEASTLMKIKQTEKAKYSLLMEGVEIGANCTICDVTVAGCIDLMGCRVSGDLVIMNIDAEVRDKQEVLIGEILVRLQRSRIEGVLAIIRFKNAYKFCFDLHGCRCKEFSDDKQSWPHAKFLIIGNFDYEMISRFKENEFSIDPIITIEERLQWLHLQAPEDFKTDPWQQLANVYIKEGDIDTAKKILIDKEKSRIAHGNLKPLTKFWKQVLGLIISYGYKPSRALLIMFFIVFLGALVFRRAEQFRMLRTIEYQTISDNAAKVLTSEFNSFFYAIDLFVPFLDLNQDKFWTPTNKLIIKGSPDEPITIPGSWLFRGFYWSYICLGWLFSTLLAASWTGLLKKD